MSSTMTITPELMAGFLDEAPEYLEMLDDGLMDLESKAGSGVLSLDTPEDQEQMTTMFRAAHSLKGLAAAFGFDKIKELTHRMETLFDEVRMHKRTLSSESFETLFRVFDRLKLLVEELKDETSTPVETEDILAELDSILRSTSGDASEEAGQSAPQSPDDPTEAEPVAAPTGSAGFFDDPELASLFVETTAEGIDELNQGLLGLEKDPTDAELLNTVFRCAHNIKGASGAVGLDGMNRLTHEIETVFDRLRSDQITLDVELMNAVFQAVDQLRAVVEELKQGRVADVAAEAWRDRFSAWLSQPTIDTKTTDGGSSASAKGVTPDPSGDAGSTNDGDGTASGDGGSGGNLQVAITFASGFAEASIQAYLIHNKLLDLAEVISSDPDVESMTGDTSVDSIKFLIESDAEPSEIDAILQAYDVESVTVTRTGDAAAAPGSGASSAENDAGDAANGTVSAAAVVKDPSEQGGTGASVHKQDKPAPSAAATASVPNPAPRAQAADSKVTKPGTAVKKPGETLRVDQERLDQLMNLGGELVINKARFLQVHRQFREVFGGKNLGTLVDDISDNLRGLSEGLDAMRAELGHNRTVEAFAHHLLHLKECITPVRTLVRQVHDLRTPMFDFDEAIHALTRVSEGIQKGIMGTRMVPVGPTFNRFKRVVRDIAKANGKEINLVLRGENTELDKRMIDELGDPLTHLVRNSVDHGIETPDVRVAAGKEPVGTLILDAFHRGNSICIVATDDGAGVNLERVKAKIIEKELATEAQVEKMSDRELVQFVFKPGFSTAEKVTDVSGRGMGMDIVVNKIEKLNGTIEMESTPGQGTRVTIKLPLTLAIMNSLVARINDGVFAIPLEAVAEIITVRRSDIRFVQRRQVVQVRDRVVPLAWFEDLFETKIPGLQTASRDLDELTLVIIGVDNDQIGLVVDELLGQEDVVIKSIAEHYRNVRGFAGASIRGDGSVSLILDVGAVMELAAKVGGAVDRAPAPVADPDPAAEPDPAPALVEA